MLANFIENNYTPAQAENIVDALEVFGHFNLLDVINDIDAVVHNENAYDNYGMIMEVNAIVHNNLHRICNLHRIYIQTTDVPMNLLVGIAKSLYLCVEEYDPDWIRDHVDFELSDANGSNDIFASIVECVTDFEKEDALEVLVRVDDSIIKKIEESLNNINRPALTADPDNRPKLDAYKAWLDGKRTGVVYTALAEGILSVGRADALSITSSLEQPLSQPMRKAELAFELASVLMISTDEPSPELIEKMAAFFEEGIAGIDDLSGMIARALQ